MRSAPSPAGERTLTGVGGGGRRVGSPEESVYHHLHSQAELRQLGLGFPQGLGFGEGSG